MENYRPITPKAQHQAGDILPLSIVTLIPLPVNSLGSIVAKTVVSHVVTVTKEDAADVPLRYNYWAETKIVTIEMNLHFDPDTVSDPTEVSIALDLHTFTVDISPGADRFLKDVRFSVHASNLDLSCIPDGASVFLFHLSDGLCEIIPADAIRYDKNDGTLTLAHAHLSHFSVYGFGFVR